MFTLKIRTQICDKSAPLLMLIFAVNLSQILLQIERERVRRVPAHWMEMLRIVRSGKPAAFLQVNLQRQIRPKSGWIGADLSLWISVQIMLM